MPAKLLRTIFFTAILFVVSVLHAQTVNWAGHTWKLTSGGMAGQAHGDPANVTIDDHQFLHLQIVKRDHKWTSAELFTTEDFGFGTYQWVIEGKNIYKMDPNTVLGLFTYGPVHKIGGEAEDEIDIEFSQWNKSCHGCVADFTVYPSTGNRKPKGVSAWEDNFYVKGAKVTTARFDWKSDRIVFTLMKGDQPVGTRRDVIKTETYSSSATNIPQVPLPVGINLWCYKKTPHRTQSVVIRSFQLVPH